MQRARGRAGPDTHPGEGADGGGGCATPLVLLGPTWLGPPPAPLPKLDSSSPVLCACGMPPRSPPRPPAAGAVPRCAAAPPPMTSAAAMPAALLMAPVQPAPASCPSPAYGSVTLAEPPIEAGGMACSM
jgi:hypothetical protein